MNPTAPQQERYYDYDPNWMRADWGFLIEPTKCPDQPSPTPTSRERNGARNGTKNGLGQGKQIATLSQTQAVPDPKAKERKDRMLRRTAALRTALEGLLIACGWGVVTAQQFVGWWVADRLSTAQAFAGGFGYDYDACQWRITKAKA